MDAQTIIDALGGTTETASLCKISPGAVSQWIKNGIPDARLMFLKLARPEIFAGEVQQKTTHTETTQEQRRGTESAGVRSNSKKETV